MYTSQAHYVHTYAFAKQMKLFSDISTCPKVNLFTYLKVEIWSIPKSIFIKLKLTTMVLPLTVALARLFCLFEIFLKHHKLQDRF